MPDPLDALRAPITPADPDPAFSARLRERLVRALDLPRGVSVSTSTITPTVASTQLGAAIPYLTVSDGQRAIDWYTEVFGAELADEPYWMPDGKIGHAELRIGAGAIYLADEFPPSMVAPSPDVSSTGLAISVSDVDSTVATAVAAGGRLDGGIYENYGYRSGTVYDPFGHRWMIRTPLPVYRHGDIAYAALWVPDVDRATEFFGAVLGWSFAPARDPRHRRVEGTTPPIGIWGGQPRNTLYCCYAVDDVVIATEQVRAAGGTAQEPTREPYGLTAMCVDDQGVDFAVVELEPGATRPASGEISYYTFEVPDSARTRAFYGSVLGWTFNPGRISDGWAVNDAFPMTGLSGGHDQATGVPMWRVSDVAAAVERVRWAGGTATDPENQPYGVTSECTDDQGTRFSLGQH